MRTSFLGYETGRRALQAQQLALEVTGHNIANANVKGYSRQLVRVEATTPYALPTMSKLSTAGMVGTGVEVTDIRAVRDFFLDAQVRSETANIGYWETRQGVLEEIEVILGEPQGTGLSNSINQFSTAWQNVAANPSSEQFRQVLIQAGNAMADAFGSAYNQLASLKSNLRTTTSAKIVEANAIFRQVADLNRQIAGVTGVGDSPNDLIDTRNRLTEQLSRLMEIDTRVDARGVMTINVAGHTAVNGFDYDELMIDPPAGASIPATDVTAPHVALPDEMPLTVYWRKTSQLDDPTAPTAVIVADPLRVQFGEIGSALMASNETVQDFMNKVEIMAQEIVHHVNQQHEAGWGMDGVTGRTFFSDYASLGVSTSCAASMQVTIADGKQVAAAAVAPVPPATLPLPGDGGNADLIVDLFEGGIVGDAPAAVGTRLADFFRGIVGRLGVATQESERMAENERTLLTQIDNQRAAATGVSTDEELINMVKFQQGYNAAARIITTVDEMIDTIINRMGLVGR